jgi:hypothetical protein
MFDSKHCPLLQPRLNLGMKLMYASGVWSYVVRACTDEHQPTVYGLTVALAQHNFRASATQQYCSMLHAWPVLIFMLQSSWVSMHVGRCHQHAYVHHHPDYHHFWGPVSHYHQLVGSARRDCVRHLDAAGTINSCRRRNHSDTALSPSNSFFLHADYMAAGLVLRPQPKAPRGFVVRQCWQPGTLVDIREGLLARSGLRHCQKGHHLQDHYEGAVHA